MSEFDWLIVGAGFAGSVLAERLASQRGDRVLIIDRRPHIGGNAYDKLDDTGVLIHQYGPHIFHTNSEAIFSYLSKFTQWRAYEHRVLASVDDKLLPIPINLDTVNKLYGLSLTSEELEAFFAERAESVGEIRSSEDVVVSTVGRDDGVRVIKGDRLDPSTAQTPGMFRQAAINHARVGAQKIWAGTVTIEPDAKTGVHHHGELESVIFVLRGRARMRWGDGLEYVAEAEPGDFIYVPPFVPHQEINADPNNVLECVLVRSDNEAVVVNITDVDPVEAPEEVYWVDPIHKHPGG